MFPTIDLQGKRVLFITTKNLDYLRNVQEINLLRQKAESVSVIGFKDKSYPKRLLKVYKKILTASAKDFDCVFIGFAPQLVLPWFWFKFKKKTVLMDFFISVYDTLVFDRKKFKVGSLPAKLCKWLDKKCINQADAVVCDTNAHGDYFSDEFDVPREKINTLYLEADTSVYDGKATEKPENLKDKFVVLYFGSILPLQGIDIILDAAEQLKSHDDIHFIFIGPVKDKYEIPKRENFEYYSWLTQQELAKKISYSDLCLAGHFNADINKAKRTIPGKAYIYEAMNKPMILGDNPATHELYREDDRHFFVKMGDADKLAEKILEIKKIKYPD